MRLTEQVHALVGASVGTGDTVIDATMGNGHDTLMLSQLVGTLGTVLAFDIQAQAEQHTRQRLDEAAATNATLVLACHSRLVEHLPAASVGHVAAIVFNLGYLPGAQKTIATQPDTTSLAIRRGYDVLREGGLLSVLAYVGHAGGEQEGTAAEATLDALPDRQWVRRDPFDAVTRSPRLLAIRRTSRG